MNPCDELLEDLERFKSDKRNEYPLKPIEKWMIEKLSVKRLEDTGGSAIRFEHPILEELKGDSTFVVHRKHGGKREIIYRKNFLMYLYPILKDIIRVMRERGLRGNQDS